MMGIEKDLIILIIATVIMLIILIGGIKAGCMGLFISLIIYIFIIFLVKDNFKNVINYLQQEKSKSIEKVVEEKVQQELQKIQ